MKTASKNALQHDKYSAADFHKTLPLMLDHIDFGTQVLRTSIRRIRKLHEEHFATDKPSAAPSYRAAEQLKIEMHFFNRYLELTISSLNLFKGVGTLARHVLGESELQPFLSR